MAPRIQLGSAGSSRLVSLALSHCSLRRASRPRGGRRLPPRRLPRFLEQADRRYSTSTADPSDA